jgi:hypothetical protein
MMEMQFLADLAPEDLPEASRFLLEINFTELLKSLIETQKYLTLAVNAALAAQNLECARGVRAKRIRSRTNANMPSWRKLGLIAIEQRIQKDSMHQSPTQNNSTHRMDHTQTTLESYICKHPHPATVMSMQKLNKRLRKPDWHPQIWANCVGGYTLLILAFRTDYLPDNLRPKGLGTYHGTQPNRPMQPCCGKKRQSKRL